MNSRKAGNTWSMWKPSYPRVLILPERQTHFSWGIWPWKRDISPRHTYTHAHTHRDTDTQRRPRPLKSELAFSLTHPGQPFPCKNNCHATEAKSEERARERERESKWAGIFQYRVQHQVVKYYLREAINLPDISRWSILSHERTCITHLWNKDQIWCVGSSNPK